ncbi:MAG: sigma 54-interacting transcriptional regulator [Myxococcota bacterium]|jgi:PAS domain S-box-containing protein|nr:sigma 54-interacting transcriptional regulator [Myxococcota bacterium]
MATTSASPQLPAALVELLEKSREALPTLLESVGDALYVVDTERNIIYWNPQAEHLTGFTASEVLGRHCLLGIRCVNCLYSCELFERGEVRDVPVVLRTKDSGTVHARKTAFVLRDDEGQAIGAVEILRDETALRAQIDRCQAQCDRIAQLETLSEKAQSDAAQGTLPGLPGLVGQAPAMRELISVIEKVAPTDATVLITGESGTGKERVARAIHERSRRSKGPFVAINCAALPLSLLETELFGHVRGAFTGAVRDRMGLVEEADAGTLFLDEVGDMPLELQSKLLRFLELRRFQRVGDNAEREVDVRLVSATNRPLLEDVAARRFREDLYYRLRVIPLHLPPLRERVEDIPLLAAHLLPLLAQRLHRPGMTLSPSALERLLAHRWPGNVRELVNALEYAVAMSNGKRIRAEDLPAEVMENTSRYRRSGKTPQDEASRIRAALESAGGNRAKAARLLGMHRVTLYRKLEQLGIE